jgi:hypothetical protein
MDNCRVGFPACQSRPSIRSADFPACGRGNTLCPDQPPCQPAPLASPAPHQANQSPGSALCQRAGAGGDCQARHPDRNVHRSKFTCAGTIPCQATCPSSQSSFHLRPTARASPAPRSGAASGAGACWAVFFKYKAPAAQVSVGLLFQQDSL